MAFLSDRSPSNSGSSSDDSYSDSSDTVESGDEASRANTRQSSPASSPRANKTRSKAGRSSGMTSRGARSSGLRSPFSKARRSQEAAFSNLQRRVTSAKRKGMQELRSEIITQQKDIDELKSENKLLKKTQKIHEKALLKYEGDQSEMPQLLERHGEEVRALRERNRQLKGKNEKAEKKLRNVQDELQRSQRLMRKMRGLLDDKKLGERDKLSKRVEQSSEELANAQKRVEHLEKHIEHLNKNHKHEVGIERARQRETQKQMTIITEKYEQARESLREKEKELDVRNIYAQRIMKPPHKLNSAVSSTASSPAPTSFKARKQPESRIPRNQHRSMEQINAKSDADERQDNIERSAGRRNSEDSNERKHTVRQTRILQKKSPDNRQRSPVRRQRSPTYKQGSPAYGQRSQNNQPQRRPSNYSDRSLDNYSERSPDTRRSSEARPPDRGLPSDDEVMDMKTLKKNILRRASRATTEEEEKRYWEKERTSATLRMQDNFEDQKKHMNNLQEQKQNIERELQEEQDLERKIEAEKKRKDAERKRIEESSKKWQTDEAEKQRQKDELLENLKKIDQRKVSNGDISPPIIKRMGKRAKVKKDLLEDLFKNDSDNESNTPEEIKKAPILNKPLTPIKPSNTDLDHLDDDLEEVTL